MVGGVAQPRRRPEGVAEVTAGTHRSAWSLPNGSGQICRFRSQGCAESGVRGSGCRCARWAEVINARLRARGVHSRFERTADNSTRESALYAPAVADLQDKGWPVETIECCRRSADGAEADHNRGEAPTSRPGRCARQQVRTLMDTSGVALLAWARVVGAGTGIICLARLRH